MEKKLNHFNESGEAHMVDVGAKAVTEREARASGFINMQPETFEIVRQGTAKKGDVLGVARLAGIMAVKRTPELIPLAHPISISGCSLDFILDEEASRIQAVCTVRIADRTGVEMEALTGVSVALLTIYDMLKAVDRGMEITDIGLQMKSGGKSGLYIRKA
ncbi:MAG: cyclic pyranopterin monophosphate synthase MoaC [Firmicutes bacterium]|nr:cyclic pyranopterin monophosphate synthase MoaC [Bacillota bacterium]MBR0179598.1 cyclic pyranopterin monophosphate synthase MoaC [Bacillota bacterium]MBR0375616.1 cyclic pyranopterin monophosphate synthase MoaC [Bacillota bacterium]MBR3391737.1 cyclic pyranopterin monophosphate synthase MoaC [Bacillota bacterium]